MSVIKFIFIVLITPVSNKYSVEKLWYGSKPFFFKWSKAKIKVFTCYQKMGNDIYSVINFVNTGFTPKEIIILNYLEDADWVRSDSPFWFVVGSTIEGDIEDVIKMKLKPFEKFTYKFNLHLKEKKYFAVLAIEKRKETYHGYYGLFEYPYCAKHIFLQMLIRMKETREIIYKKIENFNYFDINRHSIVSFDKLFLKSGERLIFTWYIPINDLKKYHFSRNYVLQKYGKKSLDTLFIRIEKIKGLKLISKNEFIGEKDDGLLFIDLNKEIKDIPFLKFEFKSPLVFFKPVILNKEIGTFEIEGGKELNLRKLKIPEVVVYPIWFDKNLGLIFLILLWIVVLFIFLFVFLHRRRLSDEV